MTKCALFITQFTNVNGVWQWHGSLSSIVERRMTSFLTLADGMSYAICMIYILHFIFTCIVHIFQMDIILLKFLIRCNFIYCVKCSFAFDYIFEIVAGNFIHIRWHLITVNWWRQLFSFVWNILIDVIESIFIDIHYTIEH